MLAAGYVLCVILFIVWHSNTNDHDVLQANDKECGALGKMNGRTVLSLYQDERARANERHRKIEQEKRLILSNQK